ncbi:TRAP transporter substrate-binding protein [Ammoniphilus resinae]|uniref:Tripartite ATP-independent transporter DctP family solute receptor n=1 Tax=Ammoniphilus resinae TaxID=861532 RepID=A0ABS4GX72_9BACL|nr:TRAP transporter substrate-binding protein [Ammoniphilus resinae]MBP1934851.1 tripartite ATP-independent transporter DctP family solute receptor [Ammoniphilus resinae]
MKKLNFCILSLTLAMSTFLTACSSNTETGQANTGSNEKSEGTKTIKIAHWYAADHVVNIALNEKFKTLVEKNSNGSLKVDVYANSQLGGEEQMYDSVRAGTLEMAEIGVIMEPEVPKIGILTLPYLFKDFNHAKEILFGEIGADIGAQLEEKTGLKFMGYGVNGFRVFSSNKPIEKIEDFEGFKVRMPNIPQMIAVGQSLGAVVSPMPISEIFTALEQKVVDGQDNPYSTLRANTWYEVQSHVLESRHMFLPNTLVANQKFWDSLSPEQQKIVQDAITESTAYEWELSEKSEQDDKKFLEEKGLKITVPDENFRNQMIEATSNIYDNFYEKNAWGKEIVDKIKSQEK